MSTLKLTINRSGNATKLSISDWFEHELKPKMFFIWSLTEHHVVDHGLRPVDCDLCSTTGIILWVIITASNRRVHLHFLSENVDPIDGSKWWPMNSTLYFISKMVRYKTHYILYLLTASPFNIENIGIFAIKRMHYIFWMKQRAIPIPISWQWSRCARVWAISIPQNQWLILPLESPSDSAKPVPFWSMS